MTNTVTRLRPLRGRNCLKTAYLIAAHHSFAGFAGGDKTAW
jgi:hypothetical protein